ncbi:NADH-quinone oxidoreductase subunit NuoF [Colwellia hornerae]|uniref:NADH-quinone oxidoreductase subunit F n=1 Tax=Colwellia hornerae TaxID=89402 RepID=A0A5C6QPI9_9GAMM|nr:NADH-quinone oxidoreductase subunit NuoF [Colwellia hornerae]TWX62209.1 NADH-quinone oxidoreductase subunit NuoF [Colwellia hornerae]TWX70611.1 NADH-quinone oxidoreductase subunit NuoF [Colwellia hornerae]
MIRPLTQLVNLQSPLSLNDYISEGGYQGASKALHDYSPKQVLDLVGDSGLKGRGGAGFPTGMKWSCVPMFEADDDNAPAFKYLVANADEMEPGTFKDRYLLEGAPHQLVEAMIIAAYTIAANRGYIFLRGEYHLAGKRLQQAINEAYQQNWLGKNIQGTNFSFDLYVHTSAGRYICGEETALINALEGRRANPRAKPPFPQISGLFGQPTVVNNVETLCNLPHIVKQGADWFKALSPNSDSGTKIYAACGRVKSPGLWELPMGTTIREILYQHAGGMAGGFKLRGLLPGGASTDFLLPEHLDTPMDFDSIAKVGSRLGTGGLIVLDDKNCPVAMVLNLMRFFAQESCGFCTPCRDGTPWAVEVLTRIEQGTGRKEDLDTLYNLCDFMWLGKTHCALAPGAVEPLKSALRYFSDEFEQHIDNGCCSYQQDNIVNKSLTLQSSQGGAVHG